MERIKTRTELFNEIVKGIVEILKDEVISIILYGSVARGTESSESDIDIALIIKNRLSIEKREELDDFLGEMDLKYDKLFSAVDINENKFETWKEIIPFYQNVSREGIVLWKAA
ncbi:MAG: nucleotidyltransferase domain-containing protein [Oscillospiraceae bacterium]|nr:nucleotidyltransferase domain-containing protein [Oscillospiraceae bacterium]MDY3257949.1 nucleotidyltransferase domain-containing protein [Ruminococcus callidus]